MWPRPGKTPLRALCIVLLAMLSLSSCGATGTTRTQHVTSLGINSDITWGIQSADVRSEVALMRYAGIRWIRASVDLSGAESSGAGRLDRTYLRPIDRAIRLARAAGLQVLMEFDRTPFWASADPDRIAVRGVRHWRPYWTYRNPADYEHVVADLVRRYAPMGVHAFELWNEPNNPRFWPSGVDPAAYAPLLRAGYAGVKSVDPSATVVMGGLMPGGALAYLQGLYAAGGRGAYDVANFHVYPGAAPTDCRAGGFCLLDALHRLMLDHADSVPAWITEFGWSTCARSPCVNQRQQRRFLSEALRLFALPRNAWITQTFIYQLRDLVFATTRSSWGSGLGVVSRQLDPKPSYRMLVSLSRPSPAGAARHAWLSLGLRRVGRLQHPRRVLVTASGRLHGYSRSQLLLVVQRWVDHGWATGRIRLVPVGADGTYRLRMRLRPGLWRVRALFEGSLAAVDIHGYGA